MSSNGLFNLVDGIKKGKGIDSVRKSKTGRKELLAMFGGKQNFPSSVMKAKRGRPDKDIDEHQAKRGYSNLSPVVNKLKKLNKGKKEKQFTPEMMKSFGVSCQGCAVGALSKFPQNIGRAMVLLYTDPDDTVFDPFAGHNSRMDLVVTAGRNYIGCDLSAEFMKSNRERAKYLRGKFPSTHIELHEGDSRYLDHIKSKSADFTITSPPYWDIEFYGNEKEQLGNNSYKGFLKGMKKVMRENYRILKYGSYAIYFINDFRRKGKFYSYHADIIRIGQEVGFRNWDILITDLGAGIRDCFSNQVMSSRILPKRHEYGVVFRKVKDEK